MGTGTGTREPRERELTNTTSRSNPSRKLFNHHKDDPVRFSVSARLQPASQVQPQMTSVVDNTTWPVPKVLPNDHVSASSTSASSYSTSVSSSAFTLSSTTDGSSASSALFEGQGTGTDDSGNSGFSIQLKKLYRALSNLETKIKQEEGSVGPSAEVGDVGKSVVVLGGKEREKGLIVRGKGKEMTVPHAEPGELEKEWWKKIINDHKE